MLIDASIKDLEISYVQQPILRLLAYLTKQILPSLIPSNPDKKMEVNDVQPQPSTMELKV